MKRLLLLLPVLVFMGCGTPDYTRGQPSVCEVHQQVMSKRTVPIAYGMIPMSKAEAEQGQWRRRQEHYPHPGDCLPATSINTRGEKNARVYVCSACERARAGMAADR